MSDNTHPEIVELRHRVMVLEGQLRKTRVYAEFFLGELAADGAAVADWAAQDGDDIKELEAFAHQMMRMPK